MPCFGKILCIHGLGETGRAPSVTDEAIYKIQSVLPEHARAMFSSLRSKLLVGLWLAGLLEYLILQFKCTVAVC